MALDKSTYDYAIGVFFLLSVVSLWTISSFLVQNLFVFGFNKPFLVTYLKTSTVTLYLLPFLFQRYCRPPQGYTRAPSSPSRDSIPLPGAESRKMSIRATAELAAVFCILWFFANWTTNASLEFTSVASSTILASTSGFFTLAVGRLFGVEKLTWGKIAAVVISFSGVLLVSLGDHASVTSFPHASWGNFLSLLSAILYAFYATILKVRTGPDAQLDTQMFFGFVGLFITLGLWPVGLVLHIFGIESFDLPKENAAWAALLISMFITWSSNYLYVLAVLRTTALVVTIGLSLTIPFAMVGDFWLGRVPGWRTVAGAILVLVAFATIGREGAVEHEMEREEVAMQPVKMDLED
ncbi:hypothetical protein DACRYDRAFT_116030 [Dacryopinax primogenitus]|uniref:EamA domain-containing protein n=1 Tax=Dacryopinax primogenitus (strain DJM 731) TaxID=1858805 RepID=M5G0N5_DACPD|nr:uncharacterized protein DACRYDRAFT_116030 [Dacryopinax primogenitus]EJU02304.1 hypothetical protein DACRYDRAFT_116030 [Dacryopinax primogenitus]